MTIRGVAPALDSGGKIGLVGIVGHDETVEEAKLTEEMRVLARNIFVPSLPITNQLALRGRARALERTLETLETPGRSVFIFGDRGVGKTSLALTASRVFNPSIQEPLQLSCHRGSTFGEIVSQVVRKLRALGRLQGVKVTSADLKLNLGFVGELLLKIEAHPDNRLTSLDPNLAVDLFNAAMPPKHDGRLVLILDELDTIASEDTKGDLAFLVKQLGDRKCPLKFIFVGIAGSVDALLKKHESASRYMATIHLERLLLGELQTIVSEGFQQLGVGCDNSFCWRIAQISDGFAHFTHLIGLKLAMRVLNAGHPYIVTPPLFAGAVQDAIEDSDAVLKSAYHEAVLKYEGSVYEHLLWSVADDWQLQRSTDNIWKSYCGIQKQLGKDPGERKDNPYYKKLSNLKDEAHGCVLVQVKRSWYQFRETMLRGYCKLIAESKGVKIGLDYPGGNASPPSQLPTAGDA